MGTTTGQLLYDSSKIVSIGYASRQGQYLTITTDRYVTDVSFVLSKTGAPDWTHTYKILAGSTGTEIATTAEQNDTGIAIGAEAWYKYNITSPQILNGNYRFIVQHTAGVGATKVIKAHYQASDVQASEYRTDSVLTTDAFTDYPTHDFAYKYTYSTTDAPVVTTQACSDVQGSTVTGNGNITDLGIPPTVTQHGHCWNTSGTPTISDPHTENGAAAGVGAFTSSITGLRPKTKYFVRAYATNATGTGYGNTVTVYTDPGIGVEMAFGDGIFVDPTAASWNDIRDSVMAINTRRGRMHELDRAEAGIANITLKNTNGEFWRYNTSGSYYPNVKPLVPTRIVTTYNSTDYPIWYGIVESFQPNWLEMQGGLTPVVDVLCVDFFKALTRYNIYMTTSRTAELSGARITWLLSTISVPAGLQNIDTGTVTIKVLNSTASTTAVYTNVMEHIYDVVTAEGGNIFVSPSGTITFQDALARHETPLNTSQATFADNSTNGSVFVNAKLADDDTFIYNEAHIKGDLVDEHLVLGGTQSTQGPRVYEETTSVIQNSADAFDKCYTIASRYADSKLRCQELEIMPDATPSDLYPKVLGYDLSTRITLSIDSTINPANLNSTNAQYHIEAIEHDLPSEETTWRTKWQLWDVNQYQIFQSQHDGYLYCWDWNYANAQTTTDADATFNSTGNLIIGQTNTSGHYDIYRGEFEFPTSTMAVTDVISSAQILLYVDNTYVSTDNSFDLTIVGASTLTSPLISTDYGVLLGQTTSYGTVTLDAGTISTGWLFINLNATGVAAINKGTPTRFGLRSSRDISATAPGVNERELLSFYGMGTSYIPRLAVKFSF